MHIGYVSPESLRISFHGTGEGAAEGTLLHAFAIGRDRP